MGQQFYPQNTETSVFCLDECFFVSLKNPPPISVFETVQQGQF